MKVSFLLNLFGHNLILFYVLLFEFRFVTVATYGVKIPQVTALLAPSISLRLWVSGGEPQVKKPFLAMTKP